MPPRTPASTLPMLMCPTLSPASAAASARSSTWQSSRRATSHATCSRCPAPHPRPPPCTRVSKMQPEQALDLPAPPYHHCIIICCITCALGPLALLKVLLSIYHDCQPHAAQQRVRCPAMHPGLQQRLQVWVALGQHAKEALLVRRCATLRTACTPGRARMRAPTLALTRTLVPPAARCAHTS